MKDEMGYLIFFLRLRLDFKVKSFIYGKIFVVVELQYFDMIYIKVYYCFVKVVNEFVLKLLGFVFVRLKYVV